MLARYSNLVDLFSAHFFHRANITVNTKKFQTQTFYSHAKHIELL